MYQTQAPYLHDWMCIVKSQPQSFNLCFQGVASSADSLDPPITHRRELFPTTSCSSLQFIVRRLIVIYIHCLIDLNLALLSRWQCGRLPRRERKLSARWGGWSPRWGFCRSPTTGSRLRWAILGGLRDRGSV